MLIYSIILTLAFVLMLPLFILRRDKYAPGFSQRLGDYPRFEHDGRPVIWLHCVSVGEANAARPLVDKIKEEFPDHGLVISTTTKTGQELAQKIFADKADGVFYFPFDWKFSVKKALRTFKPSVVLLMETEIWPRFIRESKLAGAKIAIVNGRISRKSFERYSMFRPLIASVLSNIDLALMQGSNDDDHIKKLGLAPQKAIRTGNLKFDYDIDQDSAVTTELAARFFVDKGRPLVIAASTHGPEERLVLEAFCSAANGAKPEPRLLIAPRHPERFEEVAKVIEQFSGDQANEWRPYSFARRSAAENETDRDADVVLLDSIGELRAAYPLAEIVFVGGSLIPHGGQSILEPAAAGKAIVTGPHTHNFEEVIRTFIGSNAVVRLGEYTGGQMADEIFFALSDLLENAGRRNELGRNAAAVMKANRGATRKTIDALKPLISEQPRMNRQLR